MLPQLFWLFHLWAGQRSVFWQDFGKIKLHPRFWKQLQFLFTRFLTSFVTKITVVLCSGGYTGLILGFFGGILYLYRSEPHHLADATPSQVSTTSKISLNAKTAAR